MIADQQGLVACKRGGKLSSDDRARTRFHCGCEVLLILDEDEMVRRCRLKARHAIDFSIMASAETRLDLTSDVLKRALHGSHCIAVERKEERRCYSCFLDAKTAAAVVGVHVLLSWHMINVPGVAE